MDDQIRRFATIELNTSTTHPYPDCAVPWMAMALVVTIIQHRAGTEGSWMNVPSCVAKVFSSLAQFYPFRDPVA